MKETDYIRISGIQHFSFCPRQWALILLEDQWCENYHTTVGNLMHERAHDSKLKEMRNGILTVRALPIVSHRICVTGDCDVVEFHQSFQGVPLCGHKDLWQPLPIEYKKGHSKATDCDELQLCCQAMCLEEMFICTIEKGFLFYGETHRREEVYFSDELRKKVENTISDMRRVIADNVVPKAVFKESCKSCSLYEKCLPQKSKQVCCVDEYIKSVLKAEIEL